MQMYHRLETMATVIPAAGQQDGSYLTGFSSAGLQCALSAVYLIVMHICRNLYTTCALFSFLHSCPQHDVH